MVIRPPSLEYYVPARQYTIIKTIPLKMLKLFFISQNFNDWHLQATTCLEHFDYFNQLLQQIERHNGNVRAARLLLQMEA